MNDENVYNCILYYDAYEKERGDGFYPQLTTKNNYTEIQILFKLAIINNELVWAQYSKSVIYGFVGPYGLEILLHLNDKANVKATKIINSGGRIIFPTTKNTTYRLL